MRRTFLALAGLLATLFTVPTAHAAGRTVHCVAEPGAELVAGVTCATYSEAIQGAVNSAASGDAVLIGAGTYTEAVEVDTPDLIIRGVDRNQVVLDGGNTLNNGIEVTSDDVEVSNLTVQRYRSNGVFFTGSGDPMDGDYDELRGFLVDHVNANTIGVYGIYTFKASGGVIRNSYGANNADSPYYIGGCQPCDATIEDSIAVRNSMGYSGTNAGGNLYLQDNFFIENGAGYTPNSLNSEPFPPQRSSIIRRNVILNSGTVVTPATGATAAAEGIGIADAGGSFNQIENNTVLGSTRYGIAILPYPETGGNGSLFQPFGNTVMNNTVQGSGYFDLAMAAGSGGQNCFSGNTHGTSDPPLIETIYACDARTNPLLTVPVSGSAVTAAEAVAFFVTAESRTCESIGGCKTADEIDAELAETYATLGIIDARPNMADVSAGLI